MQVEQGVKKLFVMLLLDPIEHSSDLDPWPWGGESIYRNDEFCGTVGLPIFYGDNSKTCKHLTKACTLAKIVENR